MSVLLASPPELLGASIRVGEVTVRVRCGSPAFLGLVERRYEGFLIGDDGAADYEFDVELIPEHEVAGTDADLRVWREGGLWHLDRGDFVASFDPVQRRGTIRQAANPYSLDSVLRIVHSLALVHSGSFLLHAGGAIRNGKAFLFTGVSGAGKTTITRLAPADATLLTDEISYVVRQNDGEYFAYGTPFAGELAKSGENVRAPLGAVYILVQGPENSIEDVPTSEATRTLMRNVLFFAEDPDLVMRVFDALCDFVERVPVRRLTFLPDTRVWELIQ